MSGPAGAAAPPTAVLGLGLDLAGPWQVQGSRVLAQSFLLGGSAQPPPPTAGGARVGRARLRLPSLAASARGRGSRGGMESRLSLSEPSLLTLNDSVHLDAFSPLRRPSALPKRHLLPFSKPPLLPCRSWHPPGSGRPAYVHFSQALQPGLRSRPLGRHSQNPGSDGGDLRPSAAEPLSVVGRPCLPSCGQRSAASAPAGGGAAAAGSGPGSGPGRAQIHVFLPTEAEGEEVDSESVDEGFMDELDSKVTSLRLQQGAPKTLYHC